MKRILVSAVAHLLLLLGNAGAHAFLEHAEPLVGSEIHVAPAEAVLRFTEKLEPAFSRVHVFDAAGNQVDKVNCEVSQANPASLKVALPALLPGLYKVVWRVVSIDTHVTRGEFTFRLLAR